MLCDALYSIAAAALHLEELEGSGAEPAAIQAVRDEMFRLVEAAIPTVDLKMLLYLADEDPRCRDTVRAAIEAKGLWAEFRKEAS